MNAGSGAGKDGGFVECGAAWEMEVCWSSRVVLRKMALNHREGHWLKTVVLNVVGKGAAVIASGTGRENER
jgi:hypothetical protein